MDSILSNFIQITTKKGDQLRSGSEKMYSWVPFYLNPSKIFTKK